MNDDKLIQIFISEAKEILEKIHQGLERLRANPTQKEQLTLILQALHTLKGSAKMLELLDLNKQIHFFEEKVQRLYQQNIVDEDVKKLQHALDAIYLYVIKEKFNEAPNQSFIRVPIDLLDKFNDIALQIAISQSQIEEELKAALQHIDDMERKTYSINNAKEILKDQKRLVKSLSKSIIHTKLIAMESLVERLQKLVRQVAHELGKKVYLECVRIEGKIDRVMLERLIPSLEHILRNAIDHGIEMPHIRRELGKRESGMISLSLFRKANEIWIQLKDDGSGIDIEKVREKAIEKGLWSKKDLTIEDAIAMILLPAFSTKTFATSISGQGLGLDIVNTEVKKLGGSLSIETTPLVGTQLTIRLPFTISLNQALLFMASDQMYALHSHCVGLTRIAADQLQEKIEFREKTYPLFYLDEILENKIKERVALSHTSIIFLESQGQRVGLLVDKLIKSAEILIKPTPVQLKTMKHISGLALSHEKIVFILDASSIIDRALKKFDA